jgi:nucleoside-diphosphate-sugar epimerase
MRVAVTGSSGKLGVATVDRLRAEGHEVVGFDRVATVGPGGPRGLGRTAGMGDMAFTTVDLGDYGQVLDALLGVTARHTGVDAVVHLAAIPVNGLVPDATTFHHNVSVSFNVLHAAYRAGVRTLVLASSITAMGFPFVEPPPYLPIDEDVTRAGNTYALGKVAEEAVAAQLVRWAPGMSITALRFTNVVAPGEYAGFVRASDPSYRRDLLFTYLDARDGAQAVTRALAVARPGFEVLDIAAADSGSAVPTGALVARHFPAVPLRRPLGDSDPLMAIDRARDRIGYEPEHFWRVEFARESAASDG